MAGSRGFLLVLLLATVTCIVLIQVSLDGWIRRGSLNFYQLAAANQNGNKSEQDKNVVTSPVVLQTINTSTSTAIPNKAKYAVSFRKLASPWKSVNASTGTKNETSGLLQRVEAKVRVRDPPIEKTSTIFSAKHELFSEHEDKLRRIIRYKEAIRKRVKGDPMRGVKSMPMVNSSDVNRILLITYFRSGSSFLGELLQQNWKTFYQFEPLHYMTYGSRISGTNRIEEAFDLFNSIYNCNFTELDNYFRWVKKPKNQFLFTRSLFLWFTCRTNPRVCFNSDFVSAVCSRAPVQVIKTTRLHMWQLKLFLGENPDLNIKVVYLTRDPRGIISSRWSLPDWCNGTDCSNPSVICSEIRADIGVFEDLRDKEPSKFIRVRYEDLALQPEIEAKKLFQFLNLTYSQSVRRFLKSHTTARKSDNLDPYSTRRNSSSMAYSWKRRISFEQVKTVQTSCSDVINMLNYSLINNPNELESYKKVSTTQVNKPKRLISSQVSARRINNIASYQPKNIPIASNLYVALPIDAQNSMLLNDNISSINHSVQTDLNNQNYIDIIRNSSDSNHIPTSDDVVR